MRTAGIVEVLSFWPVHWELNMWSDTTVAITSHVATPTDPHHNKR